MSAAYTREEILEQLDRCREGFVFPMLDNGCVYPVDARLSAYRDEARWALAIEIVGYNARAAGWGGAADCIYLFGNCLRRPPGTSNDDFLELVDDGPGGPVLEDEYGWHLLAAEGSVRIRGEAVPFRVTPDALAAKGIEPVDPPGVTVPDLLRALAAEHRETMLAGEAELRERVPPDLPLVLRLDAWHHPDVAGDEAPSDNETFRLLADVLVTGDASRYRPTREPNTHWKHWPEGGTL